MNDKSTNELTRIDLLENHVKGLVATVQQLSGIVGVMDQNMLMRKKFFDQVKINEVPKEEPKNEYCS